MTEFGGVPRLSTLTAISSRRRGGAWIADGRKRRLRHQGRWLIPNGMIFAMVALELTMLTPSDVAVHAALTPSLQDEQRGDDSAIDHRITERELELFRSVQVPLRRAMEIAEGLHAGSRTVDISFDGGKDTSVLCVKTIKDSLGKRDRCAVGSGKGRRGRFIHLIGNDRVDFAALKGIRQSVSDAVFIAEKATSGKAISGSLTRENGRLNFVIIVLSGDDLKRVVLEPPRPNLWKPVFHRSRQRELRKTHRTRNRARADMFSHISGSMMLPDDRLALFS